MSDVVENYDSIEIENGKRNDVNIRYSKSYDDGTTIFIEERRVNRKELAAVAMWKKKSPTLTDANRDTTTQISDLSGTSDGKGSENFSTGKEISGTLGEQIQAAEAETDTNPSDAQKEAGNYKKGHYASVYLNEKDSQEVVNQVSQEISNDGTHERIKKYFDTAVARYEVLKGKNNANDGNNSSSSDRRGDVRLGDSVLQKGRYFDRPSLYVKTQRVDRGEIDTLYRDWYDLRPTNEKVTYDNFFTHED
ncbi:MAG: hypothetical protein ACI35M_05170 [Alistipes sp.]